MANRCEITGKRKLRGNRVSHANNKTPHYQLPNIQERALYIPELKTRFRVRVSTAGLRTLDKRGGLSRFVVETPAEALSPRLRQLRRAILSSKSSAIA